MTTVNLSLFDDHFAVVDAQAEGLMKDVFFLRYKVYCLENQYFPTELYPDELEWDRFDERSLFTALVHKRSGEVFGCVRLIIPDSDIGLESLPAYKACGPDARLFFDQLPLPGTAEVSRFAISKTVRQRIVADYAHDTDLAEQADRMLLPYATLGLIRGIVRHCEDHGLSYICAVMEAPLQRLMARAGVKVNLSDKKVMYYGVRRPGYIKVSEQPQSIRQADLDKYHAIYSGVAAEAA